jgi:hypothetical protein
MAATATVRIIPPESTLAIMREKLRPEQFRKAIWQAVKRTTERAERRVERAVLEQTTLQKARIKAGVKTVLYHGEIPQGTISIRRRPLPATYFQFHPLGRDGMAAKFGKNRPSVVIFHGFLAKVKTAGTTGEHAGHIGIFSRAKHLPKKGPNVGRARMVKTGKYAGKIAARFTLKEIYGPPLIDLVSQQSIGPKFEQETQADLGNQLLSQFNRFYKVAANGRTN